ncbi:MAG: hypothetical protein COA79_00485 [Planctomycetota bacterium]|nr:MAG: hypothetical protein COA79_00485 [Planctomycetota bacterium]
MPDLKEYIWIDNSEEFSKHLPHLLNTKYISIDLEADNQHLYKEQICLIQLSTDTNNYLIDALNFKEINELQEAFANKDIIKIIHDLEFDLRILSKDYGFKFQNLFDTKMAAELGKEEKCGLSSLLEKHFELKLNKKYQKANWTKRPLDEEMLQYSVNDSFYLFDLMNIQIKNLKDLDRRQWLEEECQLKENYEYIQPPYPEYFQIRDSNKLKGKQLNLFINIYNAREEIAKLKNISKFQILSNKNLMAISYAFPKEKNTKELKKYIRNNYADQLTPIIQQAYIQIEHEKEVSHPNKKIKNRNFVKSNIQKIKYWRMETSEKFSIPAVYIWPTEAIGYIANDPNCLLDGIEKLPGIRKWQIQEIGPLFIKQVKSQLKPVR